VIRALAPWRGMGGLREEMERVFDRFFEPRWEEFEAIDAWAPKVDFSETKDAFMVKAEIPGVEQKDVSVSLENQMLTIRGEKHKEKEEKDEKYHRVERSWGGFTRTIALPAGLDTEKVDAAFKDGVLTIKLPKAPGAKGTTIPVRAA
jgi:HSP20 family protein